MMVHWVWDVDAPDLECSACAEQIGRWSFSREWPDGTVEAFCNGCGEDRQ